MKNVPGAVFGESKVMGYVMYMSETTGRWCG